MRMMDLAPWSRSSIGFDRLFDMLENARRSDHADNYPPYNIEKTSDDTYRITLAVAGFSPAELSITSQPYEVIVAGKKDGIGITGARRRVGQRRGEWLPVISCDNSQTPCVASNGRTSAAPARP